MNLTLLSAAAASALISAIWQGAVLALAVAFILRALPGLSASVRSSIWTAVFTILLAVPFLPVRLAAGANHEVHAAPVWSLALCTLWLGLSGLRAVQFGRSALRLRAVARRSTPIMGPLSTPEITRRYAVCTSPDVDRPSVVGFWSPRVLLPAGLLQTLTPAELNQVLVHETEHLNRSDDWTNLLQKFALVLFPLHPALFWVERRLCLERELACDDRVLAITGSRKSYATCLTQLAEHALVRRGLTLALGAWSRQSELAQRVHRILRCPERTLGRTQSRWATATVMAGLTVGSVTLARTPQLISFLSNSSSISYADAGMTPVSANLRRASAPAVLVRAKMPLGRPTAGKAASKHRRPVPHLTPRFVETIWQAAPDPRQAVATRISEQRDEYVQHFYVPAAAYVPAAFAAVRTQDGWVIFQL